MALVCVAASLQQVESLRDALLQLRGVEELDSRRGELDRERETVQPAGQLVHGRRFGDVDANRLRPLDEQRDGVAFVQGRQVELGFTGYAKRLAARCQDPKGRGGSKQVGNRPRSVGEELLEVVEHDVGLPLTEARCDRGSTLIGGAQLAGDQGRHEPCLADGGERHEHRATVRLVGQEPGELDRKSGLAGAAGPDDREHTRFVVEPLRGGGKQLPLTTEERRGRRR
jgi:hypothetical protein